MYKLSLILVDESHVEVKKFANAIEPLMRPHIQTYVASRMHPKMRVAVLISGSGTNLQVKYHNLLFIVSSKIYFSTIPALNKFSR